jgi:hypothetical protein
MTQPAKRERIRVEGANPNDPTDALCVKLRGAHGLLASFRPLRIALRDPTRPVTPRQIEQLRVTIGYAESALGDVEDGVREIRARLERARAEVGELEDLL